jgi:alpha-galactosidase
LPPQCALLNNISAQCEEMTVEAAITGNRDLVYYACYYDPLTSAVLSLAEIKPMADEMFEASRDYLPQFS